jgi:hypothetical protein
VKNNYSFPSIIKNNQVKRDDIGRACSKNAEKRNACRIWWESQKERYNWEDQDAGG